VRVAAIADLHYRVTSGGLLQRLMPGIGDEADVILIGGDITDTGLVAEMDVLIKDIESVEIPIIAVLGNHDHESGQHERLNDQLKQAGVLLLEDSAVDVDGVSFVGTKGFCGGFTDYLIEPFGELAIKRFTEESVQEAGRLENALAGTRQGKAGVILHYSPVRRTLEGESPELYPFLGTSRLAEAVDRRGASFIIHGHAHGGSPEGVTPGGVPVYNVCRFVHERLGMPPWRLIEL
jgi:hypothetical protein